MLAHHSLFGNAFDQMLSPRIKKQTRAKSSLAAKESGWNTAHKQIFTGAYNGARQEKRHVEFFCWFGSFSCSDFPLAPTSQKAKMRSELAIECSQSGNGKSFFMFSIIVKWALLACHSICVGGDGLMGLDIPRIVGEERVLIFGMQFPSRSF